MSDSFYPELSPDRLSFPAPTWTAANPSDVVANATCAGELATAVCSGAPCFDDPSSPGPLNVTCLCPVYPLGGSDHTFGLTAPDVGHMGGCAAYARDGGECARQSTLDALVGEVERAWVVAAVDAMASAGRWTGTSRCRAWDHDARLMCVYCLLSAQVTLVFGRGSTHRRWGGTAP